MDLSMRVELLSAPLLNKGFVHGEEKCNYEIYLLELINSSTWFSEHYPGKFEAPLSESKGECDANNKNYKLDFKLFEASSVLRARNLLSAQVYTPSDGVVFFGTSKLENTSLKVTRIFAAFRGKSLDELYRIRKNYKKEHSAENDIAYVLKTLETKKNIMLFFPYVFSFTIFHDDTGAIESIVEGLNSDYQNAFIYRERAAGGYDTYLTCIYNNQFIVFRISDHKLSYCDSANTKLIPTFCKLNDYKMWP